MDTIKVGDKVNVHWDRVSCLTKAEIVRCPNFKTDLWTIKDELGNISFISNFCRMDKLPINYKKTADMKWDD